ncbi:four helix bundle protein [Candidatus Gottesmanbacteria bacterium]|nr:four helix bundle protein [Candidatus Gottesmanbacteria bacterium]
MYGKHTRNRIRKVREVEYMEKGFKQLIVWKRMQELVLLVYTITEGFPRSETFGLQGQMRRNDLRSASRTFHTSRTFRTF